MNDVWGAFWVPNHGVLVVVFKLACFDLFQLDTFFLEAFLEDLLFLLRVIIPSEYCSLSR